MYVGWGVAADRVTLCWGMDCGGGARCGGYWCGRDIGSDGSCGSTRCTTGWLIWLAAQTSVIVIGVVENIVVPGEIMMESMDFVVKMLELIDLFCFDFVMVMVFYSVDEKSGSFYYLFLVL